MFSDSPKVPPRRNSVEHARSLNSSCRRNFPGRSKQDSRGKQMRLKQKIAFAVSLAVFAGTPWIQKSDGIEAQSAPTSADATNATNAANNPIHPLLTFDLWNYFAPSPEGYPGRINNQGLLRASVPFDIFGFRQIARAIVPINTTASVQGGSNTGVGDLTVYDFVLFEEYGTTIGVGPLIAAPTARGEAYGSGKWQAGAAGIVIAPFNWGLLGVLINYQHSFSGNSSSPVGQGNNRTTNCSLQLPSWLLPAVYGSVDIQ